MGAVYIRADDPLDCSAPRLVGGVLLEPRVQGLLIGELPAENGLEPGADVCRQGVLCQRQAAIADVPELSLLARHVLADPVVDPVPQGAPVLVLSLVGQPGRFHLRQQFPGHTFAPPDLVQTGLPERAGLDGHLVLPVGENVDLPVSHGHAAEAALFLAEYPFALPGRLQPAGGQGVEQRRAVSHHAVTLGAAPLVPVRCIRHDTGARQCRHHPEKQCPLHQRPPSSVTESAVLVRKTCYRKPSRVASGGTRTLARRPPET